MCRRWTCRLAAACLLAGAPVTRAGADDDALLQQVKQLASQGQDAQTAAQINQYVDQNKTVITAILKGYMSYLSQAQTAAANDGTAMPVNLQAGSTSAPAPASQNTGASGATAAAAPANAAQQPGAGAQTSGLQPSTGLQSSTGLQVSGVQASGGLRTGHLAGYPSLPDVEPASSVTQPTAAQLEYAAKTQKDMQARKAYLMEHPQGYIYGAGQ